MDLKIYKTFNKDLQKYNDKELQKHFNEIGKNPNRIYNLKTWIERNNFLKNFDINYYKNYNKDLKFNNDTDYVIDYLENRLDENRKIHENYNCKNENFITNIIFEKIKNNKEYNYLNIEYKRKIIFEKYKIKDFEIKYVNFHCMVKNNTEYIGSALYFGDLIYNILEKTIPKEFNKFEKNLDFGGSTGWVSYMLSKEFPEKNGIYAIQ